MPTERCKYHLIKTIRIERKGDYYVFSLKLIGNVKGRLSKFSACAHTRTLKVNDDFLLEQPMPLGKILTEFLGNSNQCLIA